MRLKTLGQYLFRNHRHLQRLGTRKAPFTLTSRASAARTLRRRNKHFLWTMGAIYKGGSGGASRRFHVWVRNTPRLICHRLGRAGRSSARRLQEEGQLPATSLQRGIERTATYCCFPDSQEGLILCAGDSIGVGRGPKQYMGIRMSRRGRMWPKGQSSRPQSWDRVRVILL